MIFEILFMGSFQWSLKYREKFIHIFFQFIAHLAPVSGKVIAIETKADFKRNGAVS